MDYSSQFEAIKEELDKLYKAYQDGYIYESEEVLMKWLAAMSSLILDLQNVRQVVGIQYYNKQIEKDIQERIDDLHNEINNTD